MKAAAIAQALNEIKRVLHRLEEEAKEIKKRIAELLNRPRQDNRPSPSDRDQASEKNCTTGGKASPSADVGPAPSAADNAEAKWYCSFQWWKSSLEFVGILAGIAYAVVTWLQWRDLRHNFQTDQRAWVDVTSTNTIGGVATENTFGIERLTIFLNNTGRTPAVKVSLDCCVETMRPENAPIPDYDSALVEMDESTRKAGVEFRKKWERIAKENPDMRIDPEKMFSGWKAIAYAEKKDLPVKIGGVIAPSVVTEVELIDKTTWNKITQERADHATRVRHGATHDLRSR